MNKKSPYAILLRNGYIPPEQRPLPRLNVKAPRKSRNCAITLNCTKEERKMMKIASKQRKMTLSNFIRTCVFDAVNEQFKGIAR